MTPAHFQKCGPDRNMTRFYRVDVTPTVFGEESVARSWGRIGTRGRTAIEPCPFIDAAEAAEAKTIRAKLKGGYPVA